MDKLIEEGLNWLKSIPDWNTPQGWVGLGLLIVIGLCALVWLIGKSFETWATIKQHWKDVGLPTTLSAEKRVRIRQRKQFCKVLRSDLESLNKAENWNDQFFTDLEAEVEAEGSYYVSAFHRTLRWRSRGLRRVPSLIKAIESSAESTLLVIGEPGSGKSVALRHLAIQLAERGIRSSDLKAKVPLYVNLKELPPVPPDGLNADFIRNFVIENVRRGDADTAEFVRQNWKDFCERGIWFFLFDSFDEIPAVLHAPSGSPVIYDHARAIRHFMDGLSDCRGCLASREFKGPDSLPWQKLRILALSSQRQEELIRNAYLSDEQKTVVRHHLASQTTALRHNPLFLTLLCRHVKLTNAPPINDHDLLDRHLDYLAHREPEHTIKHYHLTPEKLLDGAMKLSVLFAEDPTLSLAPTLDQIKGRWPAAEVTTGELENLVGALVDVKIGRSDVREARVGDRRFTFAHRRYQETLFVRFLIQHPAHISPSDLLTDRRWREYTVTLLHTQPAAAIHSLMTEATSLLEWFAREQIPSPIEPEFGGHLHYYDWRPGPVVDLLRLLQEGMARRLPEVPTELSNAVEALLGPRWQNGDQYDRKMVLELGALLPQHLLKDRLTWAINDGCVSVRDAVFQQIVSLADLTPELTAWVQRRISDETLYAVGRADLVRIEALCGRLPDSVGGTFILNRCSDLRWLFFLLPTITRERLRRRGGDQGVSEEGGVTLRGLLRSTRMGHALLIQLNVLAFMVFSTGLRSKGIVVTALGAIVLGIVLCIDILYACRTAGCRLSLSYLGGRIRRRILTRPVREELIYPLSFVLVTVVMFVPGLLLHGVAWLLGFADKVTVHWYVVAGAIVIGASFAGFALALFLRERTHRRRLQVILATSRTDTKTLLRAESLGELRVWLKCASKSLLPTDRHLRSLARLLASERSGHPKDIISTPLFHKNWDPSSPRASSIIVSVLVELRERTDDQTDQRSPPSSPIGGRGHA